MQVWTSQSAKRLILGTMFAVLCGLTIFTSYYYFESGFTSVKALNVLSNPLLKGNQSKGSISARHCVDGTCEAQRVAIINPTFTAAAYSSFYGFYKTYKDERAVTTDLDKLSSTVPTKTDYNQQSAVDFLSQHLTGSNKKYNITILTDADVDEGSVFSTFRSNSDLSGSATNAYDILILFHSEYVTQKEYQNIKTFVANGGALFVMDGNVFYAEVTYDRAVGKITFVKGHGWEFDGKLAKRSISERWANETTEWMGSNYLCYSCKITFGNNPFDYRHHEEQYITNPDVTIIKNYAANLTQFKSPAVHPTIATYEINHKSGKVFVMGLYSSDIIQNPKFLEFFDALFPNSLDKS